MLKAHMDARERTLLAISQVPANSGHPLHKGTPREAFIKEFLISHLPENVAIGTGEIIDATSAPNAPRNQFDIVIYKKSFPKLDFGGGTSGFLVESVVATVEVKSTLTRDDLLTAIRAARNAKVLVPNFTQAFQAGYIPPKPINFVVSYDGPAHIATVHGWLVGIHRELGIDSPALPADFGNRCATPAPSIDGVFMLGRGFMYFDNSPIGFVTEQNRREHPELRWVFSDSDSGNLLLLFTLLFAATANIEGRWLNPAPYLSNFRVQNLTFGAA